MRNTILVVDDELGIRELLKDCLEDGGYKVLVAENASDADRLVKDKKIDLVLLDVWLPDMDGISLFKRWRAGNIKKHVIMMSGHASISSALEGIRLGAKDFIEKPLSLTKLLPLIDSCFTSNTNFLNEHEESELVSEIITLNLNDSLKNIKEILEKRYFLFQLEKQNGNISKVSEVSHVDRAHLYRKLKLLGINSTKQ